MSEVEASFAGDLLKLHHADGSEHEARLPWPVRQAITTDGVTFVRVEPDPGACFNENVFAIDNSGTVCWQIPKMKHAYDDSPYTHIAVVGGRIKADNWDGLSLLIESSTREIVEVVRGR